MENLYIKLKNLYKNVYNINIYLYDNINIIKYYKYLNNDFSISNECLTITINKNYDVETASELERRFLNSIRTGDPRKFKRAITKIIESKNDS